MTTLDLLTPEARELIEAEAARQQAQDAVSARLEALLPAAGGLPSEHAAAEQAVESPRPASDQPATVAASQAESPAWTRRPVEPPAAVFDGDRAWSFAEPPALAASNPQALEKVAAEPGSPLASRLGGSGARADWMSALASVAGPGASDGGDSWSRPATLDSSAVPLYDVPPSVDPASAPASWSVSPSAIEHTPMLEGASAGGRGGWSNPFAAAAPERPANSPSRKGGAGGEIDLSAVLADLDRLRTAASRTADEFERIRGPVQPALPALPANHGAFRI